MHRINKLVNQLIIDSNHINPRQLSNHTSGYHGGDLVANTLSAIGVGTVYTLTGGHISPILVGCDRMGIRIIDVRDEVTAVFAADAQSRVSDNLNGALMPGIAIVTAGSGVTNTITAVKEAELVESPLVLIGGAPATDLKGRDTLLDCDTATMMKPYIKWSKTVQSLNEIIPTIYEAVSVSTSDVPGPVFIECPIDILWTRLNQNDFEQYIKYKAVGNKYYDRTATVKGKQIDINPEYERIVHKLANATSPLMIVGSQVLNCNFPTKGINELVQSIELLNVPTYLQGMARGLLGTDHPLLFRHFRTKFSLKECDMLLLLGTHCDFRIDYGRGINKNAYIVMVNLSADKLGKNNDFRAKDLMYQCHAGFFLLQLAQTLTKIHRKKKIEYKDWMKRLRKREEIREIKIDRMMLQNEESNPNLVDPIRACRVINQFIHSGPYKNEDIYIISDAGDFGGTAAYLIKPKVQKWLDAGTWTLGCGAGFALGIKGIKPGSTCIILFGDGAIGWSLCEFDTFARHKINIIAIVGNNAGWEQIYRAQSREFPGDIATKLGYTRYDKVVEPFGCKGICVKNVKELSPALNLAMVYSKQGYPVLINVLISRSKFREFILSK